jgi:predicted TPR repeat methyltransferase
MGKASRRRNTHQSAAGEKLSIHEAIGLAVGLQQRFRLDDAEKIYRRILRHQPDHADALHFLGVLNHQRGRDDEAVRLISAALVHAPDYVDAHINLGNVYREQDRLDEAEGCYRRVLELASDNVLAHNNLGSVLNAKRRFDEAEKSFFKAIALDPAFAGAYNNLGNVYSRQGKIHEAVTYYAKAVVMSPKDAQSQRMLGTSLICLGRAEAAADVFRQWLDREPNNPEPRHLLAACSGENVPSRAPDDFIRQIFDTFSSHFDARLERLEYRAPQLIVSAIAKIPDLRTGDLDILDAGCGTGLCGVLLRSYAGTLDGVDLSGGMLRRAEATACYDSLEQRELTAYLQSKKDAYDLIVSADTLCYFGDLSGVMHTAAGALRPAGHFIFTVEHASQDEKVMKAGYRIGLMGRYAHSRGYIERMIAEADLRATRVVRDTLRKEMGAPVAGLVVTASAA